MANDEIKVPLLCFEQIIQYKGVILGWQHQAARLL